MAGGIMLAAQQALLLRAEEHELQRAARRIGLEIAHQLHQDHAAGRVVVHAGGKIHAVIVPAQQNFLIRAVGAGDRADHVPAFARDILIFDGQAHGFRAAAHQIDRVGGAHIDGGQKAERVGQHRPQLADVEIRVCGVVAEIARPGDHARRARLDDALVGIAPDVVGQNDLAARVPKERLSRVLDIEKTGGKALIRRIGAALEAGHFVFFMEGGKHLQLGAQYVRILDRKRIELNRNAEGRRLAAQNLSRAAFLAGAAHPLEGHFLQKLKRALLAHGHARIRPFSL